MFKLAVLYDSRTEPVPSGSSRAQAMRAVGVRSGSTSPVMTLNTPKRRQTDGVEHTGTSLDR